LYTLTRHLFLVLLILLGAGMLAGCGPSDVGAAPSDPQESELLVFAATSLTDAFDELAAAFEDQHPGLTVVPNYGASSQLAIQITEGAEADIFASANEAQMAKVQEADRIDGEPVLFVTNRLVIITPADNPAGITTPVDLAQPGVKLVLAAPDVPIREYSDQVIAKLGDAAFQQAVYANLVSEEANVRQVVTKVALGEADAGIVYTSDITPEMADALSQIAIADNFNVIAQYPIAQVSDAPNAAAAQAFIAFVLSDEGQAILARWGFGPAPQG